jgi:hypothetical protein
MSERARFIILKGRNQFEDMSIDASVMLKLDVSYMLVTTI